MSKLIVNTGTLSAGGAERVLSVLSTPFADAYDEVQYVMWLDNKYPDIFYDIDSRIKVVRISKESNSTKIWRQMLWYRSYIKKEKPDVVVSFMVMICFTVTISLLFSGIVQVVAERNDPRFFKNKLLRALINLSYYSPDVHGIILQSKQNQDYFSKSKLYRKTSIIYNPISIESSKVGCAICVQKEKTIVSVGRLTTQKQQGVLLDAFAIFHKLHPAYKLIIYGDGEERNHLLEKAKNLGIDKFFYLPGRVSNIVDSIKSADVFVLTSDYEGMSNALIEAMCLGLPCVSTKVSGATDLIEDGQNGFLVDLRDSVGIANRIDNIVTDSDLREKLSRNATFVYNKLDKETVCSHWLLYLHDIINPVF